MNQPLSSLIKKRKFDWVNPDITDERFPIPDRLWNDYKLFHFGERVSSEEAVERMQKQGYEPANSHELLQWNDWNEEDFVVVALGSVAGVYGYRYVLCLHRCGLEYPLLLLYRWDDVWLDYYRFLAVRNKKESVEGNNEQLGELVRDLTQVTPRSKSEVRRRLEDFCNQAKTQAYQEVLDLAEKHFEELHGGGNGRRLVMQFKDKINQRIKE